jgi:hypothetical protein
VLAVREQRSRSSSSCPQLLSGEHDVSLEKRYEPGFRTIGDNRSTIDRPLLRFASPVGYGLNEKKIKTVRAGRAGDLAHAGTGGGDFRVAGVVVFLKIAMELLSEAACHLVKSR